MVNARRLGFNILMQYIENFLKDLYDTTGVLSIVGGSPLFKEKIPNAISINGFHSECSMAAINSNRSDYRRCNGNFEHLIAPNPTRKLDDSVIIPTNPFLLPDGFPGRQPTIYFALILTCDRLNISTNVYGVCGRASEYHYGDWEMWYMKERTKNIVIHDPRPKW
jgi:hypothetical protein